MDFPVPFDHRMKIKESENKIELILTTALRSTKGQGNYGLCVRPYTQEIA